MRRHSRHATTDESSSPSDACSNTDFTIHGRRRRPRRAEHGRRRDIGLPQQPSSPRACATSRASASAEQPVNGTPSDCEQRRDEVQELAAALERLDEIEDGVRRELAATPARGRRGRARRAASPSRSRACASARRDRLRLEQRIARVGATRGRRGVVQQHDPRRHRGGPMRSARSRRSARHSSCRPSRPCSAGRSSRARGPRAD